MNNIEIIKNTLEAENKKLESYEQEYKKNLKNELDKKISINITTSIENLTTYLVCLLSNIAKCEGSIKNLNMLLSYLEMNNKEE